MVFFSKLNQSKTIITVHCYIVYCSVKTLQHYNLGSALAWWIWHQTCSCIDSLVRDGNKIDWWISRAGNTSDGQWTKAGKSLFFKRFTCHEIYRKVLLPPQSGREPNLTNWKGAVKSEKNQYRPCKLQYSWVFSVILVAESDSSCN